MSVYTPNLPTQYINQNTNPILDEIQTLGRKQDQVRRNYPLYATTRLRKSTLSRLKRYGCYGDSIDIVVNRLLDVFENKEISKENRSW